MPARTTGRTRVATTRQSSISNIPDEGESTPLRVAICSILADVHKSNAGHRKLVVSLRKIQERCCYEPPNPDKVTAHDDFDESDFGNELCRCILRILHVRKSEPAGDRIVKFLGAFLKHATDQDNAIFEEAGEDIEGLPETPSTRLTSQILTLILPLLTAKDKVVRFRCTQIIAHLVNTLDSIDDEYFNYVRIGLLKRLRDKETAVRVQAVLGLGRLAGDVEDDLSDEDEDESEANVAGGILGRLLTLLQNDPSADVRRALLLNLPFTPGTLPVLLERARDQDPGIRKALYGRLLPALGDFRHLSLTHREKLLRWGLRDRDENVRRAAAKLFGERWIEDCAKPRNELGEAIEPAPGEAVKPSMEGLLELLERIDVSNAGNEGGIALDAMRDFWERRPDYRAMVSFDEAFWTSLSPEGVFIARTFNDFCCQEGASDALRDKIPEVTRLAYLIQSSVNTLVKLVQRLATQEEAEEDSVHQEFIVEQLLHIALTLDYSDEVGRRTMFSLMREALALPELPEEATRLVVEVLRAACGETSLGEREFCEVVLESIAEVHDTIMGDEAEKEDEDMDDSFHSARSELTDDALPKRREMDHDTAVREIMVNMKCLHIAQCMLQNVHCSLEHNAHLVTMLNNLVVPAVRSQEAPIRERGLLCLGLCCLLDKNLATENLTLFLHCFTKGHEQLQCIALQIISDILAAHPSLLFKPALSGDGEEADSAEVEQNMLQKPIHRMFSKSLKSQSTAVQAIGCTALSKLMLSSPITAPPGMESILDKDELLRLLVLAYFDPESQSNPALRQALSYFIPVYCHSRRDNMERMGRLVPVILSWYLGMKEEIEVEGEDESADGLVSMSVVMSHLADWTDGRRLAIATKRLLSDDALREADSDVHLDITQDIFEKLMGVSSKEERKVFIAFLSRLHYSQNSDRQKIDATLEALEQVISEQVAPDTATRTILSRIQSSLSRAADVSRHGRRSSRAPSMAPSQVDVENDTESVMGANASDMDEDDAASTLQTPKTSPRKKSTAVLETIEEDEPPATATADDEEDEMDTDPTPKKASTPPKSRRRTKAASPAVVLIPSDQQESAEPGPAEESADEPPAEQPVKPARGRPRRSANATIKEEKPREALAPTTRHNRTRKGAPSKALTAPDDAEKDVEMDEAAEEPDNDVQEEEELPKKRRGPKSKIPAEPEAEPEPEPAAPLRRGRGRPPKAAAAAVAAAAENAATDKRRSVRAGRRASMAQVE